MKKLSRKEELWLAKKTSIAILCDMADYQGNKEKIKDLKEINTYLKNQNLTWHKFLCTLDLKKGWELMLNNLDKDLSLQTLCDIHQEIAKTDILNNPYHNYKKIGSIRDSKILISGTKYSPKIPIKQELEEQLTKIQKIKDPKEKSINTMLWIMKTQPFQDCNKRLALICANKILIENGEGILYIPKTLKKTYINKLLKYYETDDSKEIKEFLMNKCLKGVDYDYTNISNNKTYTKSK